MYWHNSFCHVCSWSLDATLLWTCLSQPLWHSAMEWIRCDHTYPHCHSIAPWHCAMTWLECENVCSWYCNKAPQNYSGVNMFVPNAMPLYNGIVHMWTFCPHHHDMTLQHDLDGYDHMYPCNWGMIPQHSSGVIIYANAATTHQHSMILCHGSLLNMYNHAFIAEFMVEIVCEHSTTAWLMCKHMCSSCGSRV